MNQPAYLDDTRAAELARLIKDGAAFLRPVGSAPVTGLGWDGAANTQYCIGYYSEDGVELTAVPGDETEFQGHNGDVLVTDQQPGHWTVGISPLEARQNNIEAYFDAEFQPDGSLVVSKASADKEFDLVLVGLDQRDQLIIMEFPRVKLNAREAITLSRTSLVMYGMTFRTFKHDLAGTPCHFRAFGLLPDSDPGSSSSVEESSSSTSSSAG